MMKIVDDLLKKYPIVTDQIEKPELKVILGELEKCIQAGVEGAVVELGCYQGTTTLFLRRLLDACHDERELHVYDSFAGLPEKSVHDRSPAGEQFRAGELTASKSQLIAHFKKAGLRLPFIHKAWFHELTDEDMPGDIALAFCDGDYYESIMDSLKLVWPRLASGGVIIVDDYANEALPGARRAVDEFFVGKPVKIIAHASLAIVHSS